MVLAGMLEAPACGLSVLGSGGPWRLPGWKPGWAARRLLGGAFGTVSPELLNNVENVGYIPHFALPCMGPL